MNITLPQILTGAAGALLILAAVKNVSPVTIVKDALNGTVSAAKPASFYKNRYGSADAAERWRENDDPAFPNIPGELGTPQPESDNPIGLPPIPYREPVAPNYPIVSP